MPHNIAIIGAGAIGRAIGGLIKRFEVSFWDIQQEKLHAPKDLKTALRGATVVFLCIPANAVRGAVTEMCPWITADTIVISVSKGLERETSKFMDEVLEESLPRGQRFALLFGPMLADELARGKGGAATVGARDRAVFETLMQCIDVGALTLEYSADVRGVATLGVLKNVYAIALGIAAGLGYESNMRGLLMQKAINEMRAALPLLGGDGDTVFSSAGIGDVVATGLSPCSRNWKVGRELAESGICYVESEGLLALEPLLRRFGNMTNALPLLRTVADIALRHSSAKEALDKVLKSQL